MQFVRKNIPFIGLITIAIVVGIAAPTFFTEYNLINVTRQAAVNGLLAFGLMIVIISGGIDLSVGSILAVSGMATAMLIKVGVPSSLAILIALFIGAGIGSLNGVLIAKAKLQPFIATLGTMMVFRGITLLISGGVPSSLLGEGMIEWIGRGKIFGVIPIPAIVLLIVFFIFLYFLKNTTFGKRIYSIGGNAKAAKLSGIKVESNIIYIYMISGILAALAGVLTTSRVDSAVPLAGTSFEMYAIAGAVIGGTSLAGGKGRAFGTLVGIFIIAVINNGLNLIGASDYLQQVITGSVIILAVIADRKK
ncbi:MAG: ribose ABC transporter permease [Tenericutes bacterium]|nr:ribose ABC transporter permease [Mycoplasmatota bacterium]